MQAILLRQLPVAVRLTKMIQEFFNTGDKVTIFALIELLRTNGQYKKYNKELLRFLNYS